MMDTQVSYVSWVSSIASNSFNYAHSRDILCYKHGPCHFGYTNINGTHLLAADNLGESYYEKKRF